MGLLAPLLLALLVLLSLRQSRTPLPGRTWALLRSLLPSWRFFEDVEPGPTLSYCVVVGGVSGPWRPALEAPRGRSFLLNADGNLYLARLSLVEQLWSELDGAEQDAASRLTSYRLVERLIAARMQEQGEPTGAHYRFRLSSGDADEVDFESEERAP
jgi:hypothetical protein